MTNERIAYFSMEMALRPDMPTYSGGLGVLAGDTIRSAAGLKLPMMALTLVHRQGYFEQKLDANGWQAALLHRAKCNSLAIQGKYSADAETATA